MSKSSFTTYVPGGAGRRNAASTEMRPLMTSVGSSSAAPSHRVKSPSSLGSSTMSTTTKFIDLLKSGSSWEDRVKLNRNKKEKKKIRDRFAVNIPNRLIFHLIIVFFLVPLCLGMLLLIRALFFGLKEDEEHPLHKKLPHSHHIRGSDGSVDVSVLSSSSIAGVGGVGDVGDDGIEKVNTSSTTSEYVEAANDEPLNKTHFTHLTGGLDEIDGEEQDRHDAISIDILEVDGHEADNNIEGGINEDGESDRDSDSAQIHHEENSFGELSNLGDESSHDEVNQHKDEEEGSLIH